MSNETDIKTAKFNPKVCTYWLLSVAFILTISVVGIPLLVLWFPFGKIVTRRYLDSMSCVLTDKALKVKKGILVRTEKTIPLEKITDMGMVQGPIMRHFGLYTLSVETAGQSGPGSLVSLTGIEDARSFREAVLAQREAFSAGPTQSKPAELRPGSADTSALLSEIRDTLVRIDKRLEQSSDRQA